MTSQDTRIILFQDIRESTRLMFDPDVQDGLAVLMHAYYLALIGAVEMGGYRRRQYDVKAAGDGAMISLPLTRDPARCIERVFNVIRVFQAYMPALQANYNAKYKTKVCLRFGWGVSQGAVHKIGQRYFKEGFAISPDAPTLLDKSFPTGVTDFIGAAVVRASRLCDFARPEGVVIDAEAFPELPEAEGFVFRQEKLALKGFSHPIRTWVSDRVDTERIHALSAVFRAIETD